MSAAAGERGLEPALSRYREIYEHAELELELAGRGELAGLTTLSEHWDALVAGLPSQPPAVAAELLQRARLMHERTHIELARLRDAVLAEMGTTKRARRAADGYAGQLRRRPRLDRSA